MIPILETSLSYQNQCPKCGADWQTLEGMLYEPVSDNREVALVIIRNCDVCRAKFKKQLGDKK